MADNKKEKSLTIKMLIKSSVDHVPIKRKRTLKKYLKQFLHSGGFSEKL